MPSFEPLDQLVRRQVDQLHLVRVVEHAVGDGLPDADIGDLADDVVQALEMLDVHRRVDVDAGVKQLVDVLPALGVTRTRSVGVGELVENDQPRLAGERRVQVELLQLDAAIRDAAARQDFEPLDQCGGFLAPMGLHQADCHVDAVSVLLARAEQHRVGLADAGAGAEEDLELAAPLRALVALDPGEQLIGVGAGLWHSRGVPRHWPRDLGRLAQRRTRNKARRAADVARAIRRTGPAPR